MMNKSNNPTSIPSDQRTESQIAGRQFLYWIVGFFLVFITVDAIFLYVASQTHTGVVTKNAYKKGLDYNQTVADADFQASLGWQTSISYSNDSGIDFRVSDKDSAAVTGLTVTASYSRPTSDEFDMIVSLEETSPGRYHNKTNLPEDGLWDIKFETQWDNHPYIVTYRFVKQ